MKITKHIIGIRRAFISGLMASLIFSALAYATETRRNSLVADNNLLKDETNPYVYPSTILHFPNRLIVEYVGGTGYAYAYFAVGPGVLGFSLNRHHADINNLANFIWDYRDVFSLNGLDRSPDATPKLELLYGIEVENMALALRVCRASNSQKYETDQTTTENSSGMTNLDAGLSIAIEPDMNLDCTLGLTFFSFGSSIKNADGTGTELKNKGGTRFDLRGRIYYKLNEQVTLIPSIWMRIGGFPSVEVTTKTRVGEQILSETEDLGDRSAFDLVLGIGANLTPSERVLGLLGAYFVRNSRKIKVDKEDVKTTQKEAIYAFPKIIAGVEVKPKDWLAARFGVAYEIGWSSSEVEGKTKGADKWVSSTAKSSEPSQTSYTIRMGLGFRFGGFKIDTELNRELLFRQGPNVVSGRTGDLLVSTSIVYEF